MGTTWSMTGWNPHQNKGRRWFKKKKGGGATVSLRLHQLPRLTHTWLSMGFICGLCILTGSSFKCLKEHQLILPSRKCNWGKRKPLKIPTGAHRCPGYSFLESLLSNLGSNTAKGS